MKDERKSLFTRYVESEAVVPMTIFLFLVVYVLFLLIVAFSGP